jgi:DNA-binding transcriptional regulator YhcF (GntR family)
MKLNFEIKKSKTKKLYIQLYEEIKSMILTRQVLPNDKLPSVRQLINRFSLNSSTILKAYKLLETEGHIYKIPGSGTYVKDQKKLIEDRKQKLIFKCGQIKTNENINFASATPSVDVFPTKKFQEVINSLRRSWW